MDRFRAARAADFVRTRMVEDGRLFATWKDGSVNYPAYLDDYANMLHGVLSLLSAHWRATKIWNSPSSWATN